MVTDKELDAIREFFITEEVVVSDGEFIDHAVRDIPILLDEIDRLNLVVKKSESLCRELLKEMGKTL